MVMQWVWAAPEDDGGMPCLVNKDFSSRSARYDACRRTGLVASHLPRTAAVCLRRSGWDLGPVKERDIIIPHFRRPIIYCCLRSAGPFTWIEHKYAHNVLWTFIRTNTHCSSVEKRDRWLKVNDDTDLTRLDLNTYFMEGAFECRNIFGINWL